MITIYSRKECGHCGRIKDELISREIPFTEQIVDVDVTADWIRETFPDKNMLPIIVTDYLVYSGPNEARQLFIEYNRDVGKTLLNEGIGKFMNEDVGRFVNEGGHDKI
jgi:glutaredoxin